MTLRRRSMHAALVLASLAALVVAGSPTLAVGSTPSSKSHWASIVPGQGLLTCGIQVDGSLWCWGSNAQGQLGDGTTDDRHLPTQIGIGSTWMDVSPDLNHSCALKSDGTAWCWGFNFSGQVGDGTTTQRLVPTQVGSDSDWAEITTGSSHTCGLRTDGSAWCWGAGDLGKLGNGKHGKIFSDVPVRVKGDHTFVTLDAGDEHTCAIATDGTLWCWGSNENGQLGIGSKGRNDMRDEPVQVGTSTRWSSISGGSGWTCGIQKRAAGWCWGDNAFGQLGDGTRTSRTVPVRVSGSGTWAAIVAGGVQTCGRQRGGTAWCWGDNHDGAVGDGTRIRRLTPVQVGQATNWTAVSAGGFGFGGHSCGLRGSVAWCWGDNSNGQLGDGTTRNRTTPVRVQSD